MLATHELKPGERLLLYRRRMNLNQTQAAEDWDTKPWTYRMWEGGNRTRDIPCPRLGGLKPHESCFITRRRAGMSRTQLAKALGVSNFWVTQMEKGAVSSDRLVKYWS